MTTNLKLYSEKSILFESASFRDPSARVFYLNDRIFRAVEQTRADQITSFLNSDFYQQRAGTKIISSKIVEANECTRFFPEELKERYTLFLEHEKIKPITYPYEWPFALLKKAAIFHLRIHLEALDAGYDLSYSSAYNIQFIGTNPIFIDTLSFRPYKQESYWEGYKQFCEQFLCPLLLSSACNISYHEWYRGSLDGLSINNLAKLLPFSARFSFKLLTHIFLHARLINKIQSHSNDTLKSHKRISRGISLFALKGILTSMLSLIESLKPKKALNTYWKNYECENSYSDKDTIIKRKIITRFIHEMKPASVLDIGCNRGNFCGIYFAGGVKQVIGVDFDLASLEVAVSHSQEKKWNFLPLYLDLTNPSPNHGWAYDERKSFSSRVQADTLVALAVLHHLVIGKNIPMENAILWIIRHAPTGLIEFVPKSDLMIQEMLRYRADIFPDYSENIFRKILMSQANIIFEELSSNTERKIFCYQRNSYEAGSSSIP